MHQPGQEAGEEADLDPIAPAGTLPSMQGGEDTDDCVLSRDYIDDRDANLGRLAVRRSSNAHETPGCLDDEVVAQQVAARLAAVPADGAVDDSRVTGYDGVIAESKSIHRARLEVLDDDVGTRGQLEGGGPVNGVLQIQGDGLLGAVNALEVGRPLC